MILREKALKATVIRAEIARLHRRLMSLCRTLGVDDAELEAELRRRQSTKQPTNQRPNQ
jgi:hypothetical protein